MIPDSTGSVDAPRARVARIARVAPHTTHTHTQSYNCRHGSRLGAGRRGWDAAEQRNRGRLAAASEMRCRHAAPAASQCLTDLAAAGSGTGRCGEGRWKHRRFGGDNTLRPTARGVCVYGASRPAQAGGVCMYVPWYVLTSPERVEVGLRHRRLFVHMPLALASACDGDLLSK